MLIPRRSVRTRQPQHLPRIDWSNPITRGLVIAVCPSISAVNLVRPGQVTDKFVRAIATDGKYFYGDGTNASSFPSLNGLDIQSAISGFVRGRFTASGGVAVCGNRSGGGFAWALTGPADSVGQDLTLFSVANQPSTATSDLYIDGFGKTYGLGFSHVPATSGGLNYYAKGKKLGASVNTGTPIAGASSFGILQNGDNNGLSTNYQFSILLLWSRELSAIEHAAIDVKPWQIFEDEEDYLFIPTAGGSTLNASASGGDTASGSASLAAQVALAAVGVSTASGTGNLGASIPLSAAGLSVSAGSANAEATITISAAGLAQAAGQAGLSANVLLAAAGAAQAAGNATLAAQLNALASGAAQASGTASLTGGAPGSLAATGGDVASGSAVLSVTVGLVATGSAQTSGNAPPAAQVDAQAAGSAHASGTASGQAGAPGVVSAAGVAIASGQASWSSLVTLTAAGFIQAMGAGAMTITVPLSAAGNASAGGHASPNMTGLVRNFRLRAEAPTRVTRLAIAADRLTTIHHGVSHG